MAEGLLKHVYGYKYEVYSGGIDPKEVSPLTWEVMAEIGIDISDQSSTDIKEYEGLEFDYVITLCDDGNCPVFLNGRKCIHHKFRDPKTYSSGSMKRIDIFRSIRDEIKEWIEKSFLNDFVEI